MHEMMGGLGFGMLGFGVLIMLGFWALIIGGVVWLVLTIARGGQGRSITQPWTDPSTPGQTPLEILKIRYAKGEISKEQFEEMKLNLGV
jgi:putative membrane protein